MKQSERRRKENLFARNQTSEDRQSPDFFSVLLFVRSATRYNLAWNFLSTPNAPVPLSSPGAQDVGVSSSCLNYGPNK